jgi:hypothetical protein
MKAFRMRTKLPDSITTVEEAKMFLTELVNNNEEYHPEDDAMDVEWIMETVSQDEMMQLNKLMDDIYDLNAIDPCEFIIDLKSRYE